MAAAAVAALANGSASPAVAVVDTVVTLNPRSAGAATVDSNVIPKDKILSSASELSKRPTVVVASPRGGSILQKYEL